MSMEGSSGEVNPQDATASDVQVDALSKDTNAEIYENRGPKKIIRVVTVMAYLISVSFVAILLSAYYIFLWEPPNPRLIERGRLRDPQMQYLIATIPSEKTDLKKKGNDFLQTEVNREYKPLMSRIAYDGDNPKINSRNKKQEKLNAMLSKLRHSLVETHAQNRDKSKHEGTISSISNNSSIKIEEMLNSTKIKAKNSSELHENTTEEKIGNNNIDPPEVTENTDPVNMLNIENTSTAATVPENKTKQKHFNERSTDANLIVNHEKDNRNYQKKNNITNLYPVKSSDAKIQRYYTNDIINGSNYLERNNSFKADEKFSKIDILDVKKLIKQDKSDDHQINDNRKNDTNNVYTSTTSKKYTKDLTNHLLSINVSDNNSINFKRNYPSNNHTEEIARNEASTMSSFYDSEYIHNDSGSHQPLEYSAIVTRNSEGERIRDGFASFSCGTEINTVG